MLIYYMWLTERIYTLVANEQALAAYNTAAAAGMR